MPAILTGFSEPLHLRPRTGRTLLVGIAGALRQAIEADLGRPCPSTDLRGLTCRLMAEVAPELVIAPVMSPRGCCDCVDVARALFVLGFRGQLRAIGPVLPMPGVVLTEVVDATEGGIDFELMALPETGPWRPH